MYSRNVRSVKAELGAVWAIELKKIVLKFIRLLSYIEMTDISVIEDRNVQR